MVWEFVFLMVVMKIPVAYLCAVVYWAIKAEPRRMDGAALLARVDEPEPQPGSGSACTWAGCKRRPRRGPSGGFARTRRCTRAVVQARVETTR